MNLTDHQLMQTGSTSYKENMNIIVFSCIDFELTSIKQKTLDKQECSHKNTCYKILVHIFQSSIVWDYFCISSDSLVSFFNVSINQR